VLANRITAGYVGGWVCGVGGHCGLLERVGEGVVTLIVAGDIFYRKAFDPESQFGVLCRIITDPRQTLNNKVKHAFLEYLLELLPLLDPTDFKDSQGKSNT
jgi:hypothetical protein